jgi:hypothetical protein
MKSHGSAFLMPASFHGMMRRNPCRLIPDIVLLLRYLKGSIVLAPSLIMTALFVQV